MNEHALEGLTLVVVLGIAAQWLAWRLHLPSILLLLGFGFAAGPLAGWLHPDALLGELLFPVVSLSVALILFEGGLTLRFAELRAVGGAVWRLVSVGALVTWAVAAWAAHALLGFDWGLALLFGAILTVTGPTVIGPLLRHVRPTKRVAATLKWEGIVIDPIGATLAVLVFEVLRASGGVGEAAATAAQGVLRTVAFGGALGLLGAGAMVVLLRRHWVPDFLQEVVTMAVVLGAFTLSNAFQHESGLLAVTVMGVALANQNRVTVKHIVEFKENLRVLLISSLFILLAARISLDQLGQLNAASLAFLALLVAVARPLAVAASTLGSKLSLRERALVAWIAPRGIVAAAVASIFALRLEEAGYANAEMLVPVTFFVIIGTVALYGLSAAPLARRLGVAQAEPQGVLFVGAHRWALEIALALQELGLGVMLIDTNRANLRAARMAGLPAHHGNVLGEHIADGLDLDGIGHLLALTPNDEVNALAGLHLAEVFPRNAVYQLQPEAEARRGRDELPKHLRARPLFGDGVTYRELNRRFAAGAQVKATPLTDAFDLPRFFEEHGADAIPLFTLSEGGRLRTFTVEDPPTPRPGQTLIAVVGAEAGAA